MKRILIIEDEPAIRMALEDDFKFEGYQVAVASTGTEGLEKALDLDLDIIILDLMLPGLDGLEICKELRRRDIGTPIIMLTARSQEIDKVLGLELGADDYMTKPFSMFELHARVKALLRRSGIRNHQTAKEILRIGPFELDPSKYIFTQNGESVQLTTIEFALMKLLMQHAGRVLKRDDILDRVWGKEVYVTPRTVDTHIANLRKKIGDDPGQSHWIKGIRGVGYTFSPDHPLQNLHQT
ncbi:MAG: response regulator transcription factor [Bacteroidales bacterium]|nr:response regulator transcription factor [Lentimicrobiaceae bacterium]MDD5695374.1 response regulator transcription factor [Bacteroidales bacterium]